MEQTVSIDVELRGESPATFFDVEGSDWDRAEESRSSQGKVGAVFFWGGIDDALDGGHGVVVIPGVVVSILSSIFMEKLCIVNK